MDLTSSPNIQMYPYNQFRKVTIYITLFFAIRFAIVSSSPTSAFGLSIQFSPDQNFTVLVVLAKILTFVSVT
jgi:hypothetical protein